MYTVITTPGFIISSKSQAEASKIISVFTRELGLITIIAQGIRLEKSKLRYYTQEYSLGVFSLVKGKEFWKLTNAQAGNYTENNLLNFRAQMALLLRRLLPREEPHPLIFDCLELAFTSTGDYLNNTFPELESLTTLRILHFLGYIGDHEIVRPFLKDNIISMEILSAISSLRPKINGIINTSLRASHL